MNLYKMEYDIDTKCEKCKKRIGNNIEEKHIRIPLHINKVFVFKKSCKCGNVNIYNIHLKGKSKEEKDDDMNKFVNTEMMQYNQRQIQRGNRINVSGVNPNNEDIYPYNV